MTWTPQVFSWILMCLLPSEGFLVLLFQALSQVSVTPHFLCHLQTLNNICTFWGGFCLTPFSLVPPCGTSRADSDSTHTCVAEQEVQVTMSANYAWRKALFLHWMGVADAGLLWTTWESQVVLWRTWTILKSQSFNLLNVWKDMC